MNPDARHDAAARLVTAACVAMAAGVALGAFGAHGLSGHLASDLLATYETAVRYHLVHGLAALVAGIVARLGAPRAAVAGWMFLGGLVLFSGSLYVLAVTGTRWLGAITPVGGVLWIAAWLVLAAAAFSSPRTAGR
jgi:uncharacterized membrane protein YgdD (TMEM256/DUF423 family)